VFSAPSVVKAIVAQPEKPLTPRAQKRMEALYLRFMIAQ
jgi:hypothetical protein